MKRIKNVIFEDEIEEGGGNAEGSKNALGGSLRRWWKLTRRGNPEDLREGGSQDSRVQNNEEKPKVCKGGDKGMMS